MRSDSGEEARSQKPVARMGRGKPERERRGEENVRLFLRFWLLAPSSWCLARSPRLVQTLNNQRRSNAQSISLPSPSASHHRRRGSCSGEPGAGEKTLSRCDAFVGGGAV